MPEMDHQQEIRIITNQGEISVDESVFKKRSLINLMSCSKRMDYHPVMQNGTHHFLQDYFRLKKDKADINIIRSDDKTDILGTLFESNHIDVLKEVYAFLSHWDIEIELQKLIIQAIFQKKGLIKILKIYYEFIKKNINVDSIEEEIVYPNIEEFLSIRESHENQIFKKYNQINRQTEINIYFRIIVNHKLFFENGKINQIIGILCKLFGCEVLINFSQFIDLDDFPHGNILDFLTVFSEKNGEKEGLTQKQKDILNNHKDSDDIRNIKLINKEEKYWDDLIKQIAIEVDNVKEFNSKLGKDNELLKRYFYDLNISEKSSDIELFEFHKQFLKNRNNYLIQQSEENNSMKSSKFQYSPEMIERGKLFKVPKIILKSLENEKNDKNALLMCTQQLKLQNITYLSLFIASTKVYLKGRTKLFHKIIKLISNKKIEDYFLYKIYIDQNCYYELVHEPRIQEITDKIDQNKSKLTKITIPKELKVITKDAFYFCCSLAEVIIEEGITNIQECAFEYCQELENIKTPSSLKVIEENAFSKCIKLKEIELNLGLIRIGNYAFSQCASLTKVLIPRSTQTLGSAAFFNCAKLKEIDIDCEIKTIEPSCFKECFSLETVKILKSLKEIRASAFCNCFSLKSFNFDGITSIGECAFMGCRSLERIQISESINIIGPKAFAFCNSLKEIELPQGKVKIDNSFIIIDRNPILNHHNFKIFAIYEIISWFDLKNVELKDGIEHIDKTQFFNCNMIEKIILPKNLKTIGFETFFNFSLLKEINLGESITAINKRAFSSCKSHENVHIPGSIKVINDELFSDCYMLKEVIIEEGITKIGEKSFEKCVSLKCIVIPKSVEHICISAFSDCCSLKEVKLNDGITKIDSYVFSGCNKLEIINIPNTLKSIPMKMFSDCKMLRQIELGEGLTMIEGYIFSECKNLEKIKFAKSIQTISNGAFFNCSSLKEVNLEEGLVKIAESAFSGCHSLEKIKIPKTVNSIGIGAFLKCSSLKEVTIEDGVNYGEGIEKIDESTFSGCCALTYFKIPNKVSSIGKSAFYDCKSLAEIDLGEKIVKIEESAFLKCISLKSIKIPKSTKEIGKKAFNECSNLKKIEFGELTRTIEDQAFWKCGELESITITKSVFSIGFKAFSECSKLKEIEFEEGITQIRDYAFSDCIALERIKIPKSMESIGVRAFCNCTLLKEVIIEKGQQITIDRTSFYNCKLLQNFT